MNSPCCVVSAGHTVVPRSVVNEIKVVLIEDNPFLLNGIELLLNRQPDINVIKAGADVEHIAKELSECTNSVILMDVSLHDYDSLHVTEKLSRTSSGHVIIVMDLFPVQDDIDAFLRAGAAGFINKDAPLEEVVATIRAVAGGGHVFPERLASSLFSRIVQHAAQSKTLRLHKKEVKLTAREQKIIHCAGQGISNDAIARRLNISLSAVQRSNDSLLRKLALRKVLPLEA
jgi:DNA-binding NarL/FixJ family response regulator